MESAIVGLSQGRRALAPLALMVGAFVLLLDGLKLLATNWRLALVEALPAMGVWLAMLDLRLHLFRSRNLRVPDGAPMVAAVAAVTVITMAAFFLNGVFAFALAGPGDPRIAPAVVRARAAAHALLGWGLVEGAALGVATIVSGRWGLRWFLIATSVVIGCIMFSYIAIPSRILGVANAGARYSRRDRLVAAVIGGILGSVICTPPYLVGRLGVAMLGSKRLLVPAVIALVVGFGLQAAASGSVRAIQMSYRLAAPRASGESQEPAGPPPAPAGPGDQVAAGPQGPPRVPRGSPG